MAHQTPSSHFLSVYFFSIDPQHFVDGSASSLGYSVIGENPGLFKFWSLSRSFQIITSICNGIEGRTEIAVAIAGQSHSRKNFRKLNYKMNGTNRKGLHRIKELSYSSLRLTEIDSQRIIE